MTVFGSEGTARTFDYQDYDYAKLYLDRLDPILARFQPIGLSNSRCFKASGGHPLKELMAMFEQVGLPDVFGTAHVRLDFRLENGARELAAEFAEVYVLRYPDALIVDRSEPLVAYARSTVKKGQAEAELDAFARLVEAEIARKGTVHITKDSGLFIARKNE